MTPFRWTEQQLSAPRRATQRYLAYAVIVLSLITAFFLGSVYGNWWNFQYIYHQGKLAGLRGCSQTHRTP